MVCVFPEAPAAVAMKFPTTKVSLNPEQSWCVGQSIIINR